MSNRARSVSIRQLELVPCAKYETRDIPEGQGMQCDSSRVCNDRRTMAPVLLAFARSHDFLSEGAPFILVRTLSSVPIHKHRGQRSRVSF